MKQQSMEAWGTMTRTDMRCEISWGVRGNENSSMQVRQRVMNQRGGQEENHTGYFMLKHLYFNPMVMNFKQNRMVSVTVLDWRQI